jgi:beta-glucosidase
MGEDPYLTGEMAY